MITVDSTTLINYVSVGQKIIFGRTVYLVDRTAQKSLNYVLGMLAEDPGSWERNVCTKYVILRHADLSDRGERFMLSSVLRALGVVTHPA